MNELLDYLIAERDKKLKEIEKREIKQQRLINIGWFLNQFLLSPWTIPNRKKIEKLKNEVRKLNDRILSIRNNNK